MLAVSIKSHIQPDNSSKITLIKIHCTVIIPKIKISYKGYINKSSFIQGSTAAVVYNGQFNQ